MDEVLSINKIKAQLKAGYVDFVDSYNIDEITIIRKAIKEYEERYIIDKSFTKKEMI